MLSSVFSLFGLCLLGARALRIPLETRTASASVQGVSGSRRNTLQPRANTTVAVKDVSNTQYLANITMGGRDFVVILDTGSSDLWVAGDVPNTKDMGLSASVKYAVGSASGQINSAKVDFAGQSVSDQAFIHVQDASSTGIDLGQINGLLGLGPSVSSEIRQKINQASGNPFLDRVFLQNTSTPNFITFLLDRVGDSDESFSGQLTIGEVVPGLEKISDQPKVPVKALPGGFREGQHWSGEIDDIIGPDGQKIKLDSLVPGTSKGKLVTIFDSGFTLPQVPRDVSDAIYGRIQGASYDTSELGGAWTIPCDQEVNLTIVIAGQNYPINPLDTSSKDVGATDSQGNQVCVGAFQPISTSLDGTFDSVMGMGFLRNTYTSINFGDFVDGNPNHQGDPFIQLLSVTDTAKAHQDFVKLRMNNVDLSGDSSHTLLPADQAKHSPVSNSEKAKNAFFRYWPWLVAGVGLVIVIGVAWLIFSCCCRRGPRPPKGGFKSASGSYRPLHDPSPAPGMDMHAMGPPHQGAYADPYYHGNRH